MIGYINNDIGLHTLGYIRHINGVAYLSANFAGKYFRFPIWTSTAQFGRAFKEFVRQNLGTLFHVMVELSVRNVFESKSAGVSLHAVSHFIFLCKKRFLARVLKRRVEKVGGHGVDVYDAGRWWARTLAAIQVADSPHGVKGGLVYHPRSK